MRTRRSALHALSVAFVAGLGGCSDGADSSVADDGTDQNDDPGGAGGADPDGTDDGSGGIDDRSSGTDDTGETDDSSGNGNGSDDGSTGGDSDAKGYEGSRSVDTVGVRVDEPPFPIDRPDESEEWDERYRCANAPEEPSVDFEVEDGWFQVEDGIGRRPVGDAEQYHVALLDEPDDVDRLDVSGDTAEFVSTTDVSESALVAIEAGWGSSSVSIDVGRVEVTDRELHVHGCLTAPEDPEDDATGWTALVRAPGATDAERATVSLTVADDRRVHFNSTEGVVTIGT